jgi:hypothetical protein
MSAQPTELMARLLDLFGNPNTADPTKLYGNLTVNPTGTVQVGTGLILPDGYTRTLTDMGRNRVINGDMSVWQRATTITGTPSGYQTVDRFGCSIGSGSGHTAAQSTDTPNNQFTYSWKLTVGTGASPAAGAFNGIWHNIEGYNVQDFAYGKSNAQYGVLTFWVKSSVAGTYAIGFMNGSLARNYITTYTITSANTWQQMTVIVPGDITGTWYNTNSTGLSICWDLGSGTTYQTSTLNTWQAGQIYGTASSTKLVSTSAATWQLAGVQFEIGAYNSPFERIPVGTIFNNCLRYYEQWGGVTQQYGVGGVWSATQAFVSVMFRVPKRAAATMTSSSASTFYISSAGSNNAAVTSIALNYPTMTSCQVALGQAGGTAGQAAILQDVGSGASWIAASAEL